MMTVRALAIALTLLVVGLSGCAATNTPVATITHGVIVATAPTEVFLMAQITGEITTVGEEECWALTTNGETSVIIFPSTTEVDATGTEVTIPGLGTWQQGDQLEGSGGTRDYDAANPVELLLPSGCRGYTMVGLNPDVP